MLLADIKPFAVFVAVSCAALAVAASASAANLPYQWNAAQVAKATGGRCVKTGGAFTCRRNGRVVYVKVRQWGTGAVCKSTVSFARVPTKCLAAPKELEDPGQWVRNALFAKVYGKPGTWQGFTRLDCVGSRGVYTCSFGEGMAGTASVVYSSAAKATVTFTELHQG